MSYNSLSCKRQYRLSTPVRLGVVAVAACFLAAPLLAAPPVPTTNLPTNLTNLVGIDAKNIVYSANSLDIVTSAARSAADVSNFNIATGYRVGIVQPSASANVLFRVLSNDPSVIYGSLSSNGGVYLVNPGGIFVGPGGQVDVARFAATTLAISNADFLAGRNLFVNDGTAKDVINHGQITTPAGGSVYLIGSNVSNEGIITTPQGETILAAGATVSLIDSALPGVKVDITGAEGNSTNLGTITAEAGRIGIAGVIVRNSGTLNASSVVEEGGRIFLKASKDAYVDGNGRIVTTGTKGGSVEVLGDRVAVMDNASIDASATSEGGDGGKILVGGDYQGKNPDIQNASITYFGPNASLKADAGKVGAGGTVIVWADDTTRAYGNISVRGGALGGNGGFVEVSGHRYLDFHAKVDRRAPHGKAGLLLLDPSDIEIGSSDNYGGGAFSSGVFSGADVSGGSYLSWATIIGELGGGDVAITTSGTGGSGDIKFAASSGDLGSIYDLSLLADRDIKTQGYNLINTGGGGFTFVAGWDGAANPTAANATGLGDIIVSGSMINSAAGAVNLWAGNDILLSNNGNTGTWIQGATMDVKAGNNLTLTGGGGSGSGLFGPGVMLLSTGAQTVTAGNQILLNAGSFDNTLYSGYTQYGGSVVIEAMGNQTVTAPTIKLWAGTGGHDNVAAIRGGGGTQDINVTTLLELKGGGGGNNNYANINAFGASTVQTIDATGAAITLTGGTSGGISNQENSADIGLSDTTNFGGSQTVYAGSITIDGGSTSGFAGAGFGAGSDLNQTFTVSGDLTMTGGSSNNADFKATPAYIGSEYGGGTINIQVGGNIFLNGGSGSAGGVLIGSLSDSDGPTTVNLSTGKDIVATGNTGGVWLGVKSLDGGEGSGVVLTAGTNSSFGGNIEMVGPGGVYIQTDADGGTVSLVAYDGVSGGKGDITQNAASAISSGDVMFLAEGSATFNGTIVASTGSYGYSTGTIKGTAGITCPDGCYAATYGGSLSFGSTSNILAEGDIVLESSRDVTINGLMNSTDGNVVIAAGGYRESSGYSPGQYSSPLGGNVYLGGTITAYQNVNITANVGYGTYGNGNVTQYSGSAIVGGTGVSIIAGGSVSLGGIVAATSGTLQVQAGYQAGYFAGSTYGGTPYGGDITLTPGSFLSGYGGAELYASNGSGYGYMGGNILQQAGSTIHSGDYSSITIVSAGNTTLNGTVSAGYQISIGAGLDPLTSGYSESGIGGDISFGSGSIVRSRYSDGDPAIKAVTSGGSLNDGHIIQAAGSSLLADSYGDIEVLAYGDARMDGTTSMAYGGYGIYVAAGAYNSTGLNSSFGGGVRGGSSNIVSIGAFSAIGGEVQVEAAGAILRSASNLNGINIVADSVSLTSVYGGSPGGIAISAFVQAADSITAAVGNLASYGGISIANFGAQPGTVELDDGASNPGAGLNSRPMSIAFYNSGDLLMDGTTSFTTSNSGDIAITSGGSLNYYGGDLSAGNNILLGAGGNLTMGAALTTTGDLKLGAGGLLDINFDIAGYNVGLAAPTINVNGDVTAANNAALIAPLAGGTINLYGGGVTAGGTSATPSYINGIAYSGIAVIAQDVVADGSSAYLKTTTATGDISGLVSGNITLTNGAHFEAGNDIDLVLAGSTSTLSLSNGAHFLADWVSLIPASIKLDFTSRTSGGVLIDGVETIKTVYPGTGSGFFVLNTSTPASEGFGLKIKYPSNAAVDLCTTSPTLCKGPDVDPYRPPPRPDKPDKDKKASCEEGSFGCEENQANDGKKDEKPGEKKVAQCSL